MDESREFLPQPPQGSIRPMPIIAMRVPVHLLINGSHNTWEKVGKGDTSNYAGRPKRRFAPIGLIPFSLLRRVQKLWMHRRDGKP